MYLFAEPSAWPDGKKIPTDQKVRHREEINTFSELVVGDEVQFVALSYDDLLNNWKSSEDVAVKEHAEAIGAAFAPC